MSHRRIELSRLGALGLLFAISGCTRESPSATSPYGYVNADDIKFKDDAITNAAPGDSLLALEFIDSAGKKIVPKDFVGKKNLVLVITRGYNGSICPYCSTYTAGLITNYKKIADRDAEVLVVYPIEKPDQTRRLADFLRAVFQRSSPPASQTPFPVVLDVELKAVDALGLRRDLSKPATYVLDKKGQVRFAYVGNSISDRPSIKVILSQLDSIKDAG